MVRGSNSGGGKRFFLLQNRPDLLWGPPRYWDSFPRIERPRLKVDYSPPRSTDIKNKWSYTPTPPYMRSWRGWELALCLSLHFNLAIQRGTAVVGCSMNMVHISIQPVAPPQSDQNTRITAPFCRTKGCVNGVATDRVCERKLYYCSFVCCITFFSHQLPPPVHNTNSTTQCIGVVCLRTEVWRAV